ncbi:MAG: Flp pilus assembly complex ATPase component TadA [Treponema sp.]|nr:Flp pilus assembly complex ATPase component TadA [Treponema sp.]
MQNFEFKLTPAYCLYNGAAVMEQKGAYIKFITESPEDSVLRKRLEKAFMNYVSIALKQPDCSSEFKTIPKIEFQEGTHEEVRNCISMLFRENEKIVNEESQNLKEEKEAAAILLLDSILDEARKNCVTDIHVEKSFIRFRRNGILENYAAIQKERSSELVIRIKLLAGMNVLEKRKSQDGSFVYGEKNPLFVRVSSMAVVGDSNEDGEESLVLRLLDSSRVPLSLMNLGFSDRQLMMFDEIQKKKNGLILICGPTGSGKSTTASSFLLDRVKSNNGKEKIISLEDPPEYVVPGITQIRIDKEKGITYLTALENVFRQDPDVIMIGEIRNEESARTALRAAMTGHLVLATLHTDSAEAAILRLKDLGCKEEIISSVLICAIVQELQIDSGEVNLLADVCPFDGEVFSHITNVPELIKKTRKHLSRKYFSIPDDQHLTHKKISGEDHDK